MRRKSFRGRILRALSHTSSNCKSNGRGSGQDRAVAHAVSSSIRRCSEHRSTGCDVAKCAQLILLATFMQRRLDQSQAGSALEASAPMETGTT